MRNVAIGVFPLKTLGSVIGRAKANLSGKAQGRELAIVTRGLNDALNRQAEGLAQRLTRSVEDLCATSPRVRIAVCTVPEVPLRDMTVPKAVASANEAIWRMAREKGFELIELVDVSREVHRRDRFQRDVIHFNHKLGQEVRLRLAGRAGAFLGGTLKLRRPR